MYQCHMPAGLLPVMTLTTKTFLSQHPPIPNCHVNHSRMILDTSLISSIHALIYTHTHTHICYQAFLFPSPITDIKPLC